MFHAKTFIWENSLQYYIVTHFLFLIILKDHTKYKYCAFKNISLMSVIQKYLVLFYIFF